MGLHAKKTRATRKMREPRPDWSPLWVNFKILDEHPYLFYRSSPPPPLPGIFRTIYLSTAETALRFKFNRISVDNEIFKIVNRAFNLQKQKLRSCVSHVTILVIPGNKCFYRSRVRFKTF